MRTPHFKTARWAPLAALLVGAPMLIGFVSPEIESAARAGVARSGSNLLRELFSMRPALANEEAGPFAQYREALEALRLHHAGAAIDRRKVRELTYAAIRGMLVSLNDPFTSFLDPEAWQRMQQITRGDFDGIGAVLEQSGTDIRVVRTFEGSPAWKAGVKAGDLVTCVGRAARRGGPIETRSTLGMDIDEVVKLIQGPPGSRISLTILRKGEKTPRSFQLSRAHIEPPTVQFWMEDRENKIGHILLNEFNEKSDAQFDRAYRALQRQGMRALVFDLRYNPGGLLNVAVDITSRFVDSGPAVIVQERSGQRQGLKVRSRVLRNRLPLAVLINESSASASEIVAGAIKDNGVGTLVGEHTFGKGLVQTLFPLGDGSALRLTTARYFTPKLNDINNKLDADHRPIFGTGGITPDVEVTQSEAFQDQDWSDPNRARDAQLKKALELLRTRLTSRTAHRTP